HYRAFHNDDPPRLVEIWSETFTGRSAVSLRNPTPLEHYVFAKPYFDPAGLIIAEEEGVRLGFAHAAFGPTADGKALNPQLGIVAMLAVRPAHRRRGIGTALLRHSEQYLTARGATHILAGSMRPLNPFYFALYGGCDSPGILASDKLAISFLGKR